jgi:hydroxymethylglutaryl-CoA reductase
MVKRKSKPKAKTYKLNIFDVLNHMKAGDTSYYKGLTEEEQKGFVPRLVMRWLTGTKSAYHVNMVNEFLNPVVDQFSLKDYNHKELLYILGTICANPDQYRYTYKKMKTVKDTKIAISVIKEYFKYNTKHAKEVLPILTNEDIISYAEDLGKQKEEITKLKRELRNR